MICFPSITPIQFGKFHFSSNLFATFFHQSFVSCRKSLSFNAVQIASHVSSTIFEIVLCPTLNEYKSDFMLSSEAKYLRQICKRIYEDIASRIQSCFIIYDSTIVSNFSYTSTVENNWWIYHHYENIILAQDYCLRHAVCDFRSKISDEPNIFFYSPIVFFIFTH